MIEAGTHLLELLDGQGILIDAAFWLLAPEAVSWHLVLATPAVRVDGPRSIYKKLQKLMTTTGVTLGDVSVIDTNEAIVQLLRAALGRIPGISGIRFTRNTINGVFIPDAYIYRVS